MKRVHGENGTRSRLMTNCHQRAKPLEKSHLHQCKQIVYIKSLPNGGPNVPGNLQPLESGPLTSGETRAGSF